MEAKSNTLHYFYLVVYLTSRERERKTNNSIFRTIVLMREEKRVYGRVTFLSTLVTYSLANRVRVNKIWVFGVKSESVSPSTNLVHFESNFESGRD